MISNRQQNPLRTPTLWSGPQAPSPAWHQGCAPLHPQHHHSSKQPVDTMSELVPKCLSPPVSRTGGSQGEGAAPCMPGDRDTHPAQEALWVCKPTTTPTTHSRTGWGLLPPWTPLAPSAHPAPQGAEGSTGCHGLVLAALAVSSSLAGAGMGLQEAGAGRHIPTQASPAVPAPRGDPGEGTLTALAWGREGVRCGYRVGEEPAVSSPAEKVLVGERLDRNQPLPTKRRGCQGRGGDSSLWLL